MPRRPAAKFFETLLTSPEVQSLAKGTIKRMVNGQRFGDAALGAAVEDVLHIRPAAQGAKAGAKPEVPRVESKASPVKSEPKGKTSKRKPADEDVIDAEYVIVEPAKPVDKRAKSAPIKGK